MKLRYVASFVKDTGKILGNDTKNRFYLFKKADYVFKRQYFSLP